MLVVQRCPSTRSFFMNIKMLNDKVALKSVFCVELLGYVCIHWVGVENIISPGLLAGQTEAGVGQTVCGLFLHAW